MVSPTCPAGYKAFAGSPFAGPVTNGQPPNVELVSVFRNTETNYVAYFRNQSFGSASVQVSVTCLPVS
ncbi:hypothetical protein [Streptomyces sp. NBC_01304]|uniref:hypothetical protein n=1 Tax=Streptomyces sp. NBC_01304 TaxID=2903818 RepID=UPI002E1241C8